MAIPLWLLRRLRILPAALLALLLGRRLFGRRRMAAVPAIESALYSDFLNLVEAGQIERVSLGADSIIYWTKAGLSLIHI